MALGVHIADEAESLWFRQLVEQAPEGILVADAAGHIQLVNARLADLLGWPPEELTGQPVAALLADRLRGPRPMDAWEELVVLRRDGTEVPVEVGLVPLPGPDGGLTAAFVHDLTRGRRGEGRRMLSAVLEAEEEERLRISSAIHDDPVQSLTAAGLRLQRLRRRLTDDVQRQELEKVESAIGGATTALRRLMFELRPPALAQQGLADALRAYLEQRPTRPIALAADLAGEPAPEAGVLLYRAAQALIADAAARPARVELRSDARGALLVVEDEDGTGFEAGHPVLTALGERIALAGGSCDVERRPAVGATVRVRLPAP